MEQNPFSGDVLKLEGSNGRWRRRVGSYRIFFAIDSNTGTVAVSAMVPAYVQDVLELHENRGIPG
jgi:mRNA-degrading endonuclease RelE of RelBE toxin-antitoxin system